METRVRFLEGGQKTLTVLEISTPLRHPLTENLDRRLKRLGVHVVYSENRTNGQRHSLTLHLAEFNGSPLTQGRRLELQTLLLAGASPSDTPPPPPPSSHRRGKPRDGHID
jgi:hypothetical protein